MQALLQAAERHLNPETGRLPAEQVKEIYAELAGEFGLEPSSVATYLPSSIKPTSAETLAYARSRRSAKAAQRREESAAAPPIVVPPSPAVVAPQPPPAAVRLEGAAIAPMDLAKAMEAFSASITAGKDQEIAQLRGQITALEAENQRLMAELYRLEKRLGQAHDVLGKGNGAAKSMTRPFALRGG
jgi:hypothetical protein